MSLVANYANCHSKLGTLPSSLSQVELAVSAAAQAINDNKLLNGRDNLNAVAAALAANSAHNLVQNSNNNSSSSANNNNNLTGKKRVVCNICMKSFCGMFLLFSFKI